MYVHILWAPIFEQADELYLDVLYKGLERKTTVRRMTGWTKS